MALAFLSSIVAGSLVLALRLGDGVSAAASSYDGVAITIGALASVPIQVGVLAFAAMLRGWTVDDYLALCAPTRAGLVLGMGAVSALVLAFDAAVVAAGRELVPAFQVEAYRTASSAGWLTSLLIAVVLIAPVGEELVFRGFLFRGLVRPGWEWPAIGFISLVWALLHLQYDWLGMAQIFVTGLMLGWFRWASGSTLLTIAMHVLINAEAMLETTLKAELWS